MIHLIQVPYDSGHFDARMGRGPSHLVTHGAAERLRGAGVTVCESVLRVENNFPTETAVTFDVLRGTASAVREACAGGMVPLVLAGNCNTTVGVVGGLQSPDVGVIWLDAHADFSTPESSSTGFIDGMGVAMLTGRCWTAATRTIPGFAPVPDECVLLVGQRDFDDDEVERLEASAINMVPWPAIAEYGVERALVGALDELTSRVGRVHLHLDMDVHNPDLAPANHFRPPGGLAPQQTIAAVRMVAERFELTSASVAAYDPKWDDAGDTLAAALALVDVIGAVIGDRRR